KGFMQQYEVDYQETFALGEKLNSFRILLSVVAHRVWLLYQLDVKIAFIHGDLPEEVDKKLPPGFLS
ncbi:reverse transcriptase domain-containing protein, partial [Mycobacterium kansasii]